MDPGKLDAADFVIVGAGSAGCVLAARLSEDPSCRVVLLEAGGDDSNRWLRIPLGYGKVYFDPAVNWGYSSEPEPMTGGRAMLWPRGKVLGGTSSINGMVYIRGQHEDYDHWRQLGNRGWSSEDVLPYFKRAEHQTRGADAYHGTGGPLWVSEQADCNALGEAFVKASVGLGHSYSSDFNGATQDGVGYHQFTIRRGRRWSASSAYLRPAMRRPNLQVVTHALAEKITFSGARAVGVAFRQHGVVRIVRAYREVILCGGTVNSPQLLMLSGIGPASHLVQLGIPVLHDLPGVGRNLRDHYAAAVKAKCKLPITLNDVMMSPRRKLLAGIKYLMSRSGPLAGGPIQATLFARTRAELATPDLKISLAAFSTDRPTEGLDRFSGFTMLPYQLRPESQGEILLKTPLPQDAPLIRSNHLADEIDRRTLVAGLQLARRLLATPELGAVSDGEFRPGPSVQTDEDWMTYARETGTTVFHPIGTCKMGVDPLAVVDPELRVRGVEGLRIADASVMPTMPSGNTNAPAIMIGERASDLARGISAT